MSAPVDGAVAAGPPPAATGAFEHRTGTVTAFDEFGGWGKVTDDAGTERFFHCTAIADGTRTIAVGTDVAFVVTPGAVGRWEAADLRDLDLTAPTTKPGSTSSTAPQRRSRRGP